MFAALGRVAEAAAKVTEWRQHRDVASLSELTSEGRLTVLSDIGDVQPVVFKGAVNEHLLTSLRSTDWCSPVRVGQHSLDS